MRLDVAVEVVRNEIVVALIDDGVAKRAEAVCVTEFATFDGVKHFGEVIVKLEVAICVGMTEILDVLGEGTEEKDVGFADFASDLDVGSVTRTDDQPAVQDKLHVAGSTGFRTCSGDMLADVRGRCDDFGFANIVVFNVDDLQ